MPLRFRHDKSTDSILRRRSMKLFSSILIFVLVGLFASEATFAAGTVSGIVESKKKKYLPNTVVYIEGVKGEFTPPKDPVVMDQTQMQFNPHVLPILKGTTVEYLNNDKVAHNVFSPDEVADKFNLGTWPKGEKRSHKFEPECKTACEAVMLCNVHPEMEAFVVVLQNPYFATVDDSGYFEIPNVPEGEYNLKVWNPKKGAEEQQVTVSDGKETTATFTLKRKKKK
jgi:plastocyanin